MAKRENHYDAAFEAYLREHGVPHVAVDETHRSPGGGETLKSLDFIVSPIETSASFLVDVKGRQFPAGRRRQFWRNWTTGDELQSLARWELLFGRQFVGLLVFAYWVLEDIAPLPPDQIFPFRDKHYAFVGVRVEHYLGSSKMISPRWNTRAIKGSLFRKLAQPCHEWFGLKEVVVESGGG